MVSSLHLILSLYLVPITSTLVTPKCVTSINVDKQTDFIVPIYYCVFAPLLCLLPSSGLTDKGSNFKHISPTSQSGMYSLLAAEGMSTCDYQKRELFSDNVSLKIPKERTAVFYESPLSVENNSRLFFRYHFSESLYGSLLKHYFLRFNVVFFVSEYILYSLFNLLSRKILHYFSRRWVEGSWYLVRCVRHLSIPSGVF